MMMVVMMAIMMMIMMTMLMMMMIVTPTPTLHRCIVSGACTGRSRCLLERPASSVQRPAVQDGWSCGASKASPSTQGERREGEEEVQAHHLEIAGQTSRLDRAVAGEDARRLP